MIYPIVAVEKCKTVISTIFKRCFACNWNDKGQFVFSCNDKEFMRCKHNRKCVCLGLHRSGHRGIEHRESENNNRVHQRCNIGKVMIRCSTSPILRTQYKSCL